MDYESILRAMRAQAWQRAKGELRAVAETYYGSRPADTKQYDDYTAALEKFIEHVEDNGLAE